jgi:hypothetical protein
MGPAAAHGTNVPGDRTKDSDVMDDEKIMSDELVQHD